MQSATEALDFEEAARLRDRISLLRGRPDQDHAADFDTSRLKRQQPGKMGLGTSDQAMVPPPDWKPPPKPDLMTKGARPGRRTRR